MFVWAVLGAALAVECVEPVSPTELDEAMAGAENGLRELDEARFRDGVNEVAGLLLPCVTQAISPQISARYHRLMALHLHALGDDAGAQLGIAAAYTLDPNTGYPDDLIPPAHPLREAWSELAPDAVVRRVPEPKYGRLAFDGTITRDRPKNTPTVAQVFDDSGLALSTHYLGPREPLPSYAAVPRQRNMLIGCAGGAVALSGMTYGLAWASRDSLYSNAAKPNTKAGKLDSARATGNALTALSGVLFGVGAGCGVGAVAIGQR